MPRLRKKFKNDLIYVLIRLFVGLFNILPRTEAIEIGAMVGRLLWRINSRDRRNVHNNLQIAYGERLTPADREVVGRQFFINSGKNLIDVVRFPRYFRKQVLPLITVEGLDHWEAAYNRGKGIFGVTGHLGNFEVLAACIASLGYNVAVIGRDMYDPRLNSLLINNRHAVGLKNIATTDSPKRIIDWLRRGNVIGVLIDIDSMRIRSMFVPVFGKPANTPIGQSVMALKTGAALVPAACVRTPDNRYKVIIRPEITFERTGNLEKDVYTATLLCNMALEGIIDEYRDQWAWIHNRWNTRQENGT